MSEYPEPDLAEAFDLFYGALEIDESPRCILCGAILTLQGRCKYEAIDVHPQGEECNP